jgi:hypothetical protein
MILDVSPILRAGVYVLRNYGRVVYVGRARRVIAAVNLHMSRPKGSGTWTLEFDSVEVRSCLIDHLNRVWAETCEEVGWRPKGEAVSFRKVRA